MRSESMIRALSVVACAALLLAIGAPDARAQLAHASASNLALSDNTTATARAFGAISVNPAGLGMPGSGFSLALVPVQARAGIGPVTLSDLADFQGVRVPGPVAEEWLTAIEASGGQSGTTGADLSGLALTIGRFGLQVSTVATANFNIPAGVAEAILFGNAGRTGQAADLDLTGLGVDAWAATTGALSYAFPAGPVVLGATGKYTVGHGLAVARATSGSFSSSPLTLSLESPVIGPCDDGLLGQCTESLGNNGGGFGMDVGVMVDLPTVRLGASVINVFNTFAWDVATLSFRPGTTLIEQGSADSDFDEIEYGTAPADLRGIVDEYTFKPTLRAGAALDLPTELTLSADVHHRIGEQAMGVGPQSHVGLGAEWRALKLLHLRAGGALVTGGTQYSGGASLVLGPVNLSAAAAVQDGDTLARTTLAQFVLSFGNR